MRFARSVRKLRKAIRAVAHAYLQVGQVRTIKVSRKTDRVVRAGGCSLGSYLAGLALTAAGTEGKVEILSREG